MDGIKIEESALQKLFRNILLKGKIPKHIALILDGNRRYARERNMETIEGHKTGYERLQESIDFAKLCGVETLTAYVFSINNFNRSEKEVNGIMGLLKNELELLLQNPEDLKSRGVRYLFVGDCSLYPEDMKPVIMKIEKATRYYTGITVNMAFAYTGRNEITQGVNKLLEKIANRDIRFNCVNENLLEKSLQANLMPPVDLLVRTGECRLSDFLTWGSSDRAVLCFLDHYWPSFSYWKFLFGIFYFQASRLRIYDLSQQTNKHCPVM